MNDTSKGMTKLIESALGGSLYSSQIYRRYNTPLFQS
jgi:hypothetical protein